MNPIFERLLAELKDSFGEKISDVSEFRGDVTVTVEKNSIVEVLTFLRDYSTCPFPLCVDVVGIDQFRRKDRFEVTYNLCAVEERKRLFVKVNVDEADLQVPTVCGVYPSANWYEREVYDMFGISFTDHPDLRRMYMPENYEHYPLRKDFPLMGIPGSIPLPKR